MGNVDFAFSFNNCVHFPGSLPLSSPCMQQQGEDLPGAYAVRFVQEASHQYSCQWQIWPDVSFDAFNSRLSITNLHSRTYLGIALSKICLLLLHRAHKRSRFPMKTREKADCLNCSM